MLEFDVQGMSCGHCVAAITRAVKAVDAGADVVVDLAAHRVQVVSPELDARQVAGAIRDAGYTPVAAGGGAIPG